ncbi:peptide/nickel transport system substrate-binding protein [Agrococcus sp. UYP10]|uniref:ABC transporter substrate-binding protein n=1 Tax=Agrococcus sp. UYP10 TaxID=1756355 RepID=UPI0033931301
MIRKQSRRVTAALALSVGSALLLSACASGDAPGASGDGSSGGDERIQLAMMIPPTAGFSPYGDDGAKLLRFSAVETLVRLNEELGIDPLLAIEWERVDDLTWTFQLRDGVTFHDGSELTPEAVQNSIEHAIGATPTPRALNGIALSVEVTGEDEITLTTDVPDPLLTNRLTSPQLAILAESAYAEDGTVDAVGTGTGPFELTDVNGTATATLDRYDEYWGDVALAAGIDASFVPDGAARAGALRAGTADLAETVPVSQVGLLDPSMVNEIAQPRTTFMTLNSESGPFADPAVRAAARAAIDPQVLVDSVYEGRADVATGLLGPAISWAAEMRGDVESATEPAEIDGVEILIATTTDRAENPEIAVQLEAQLEEAGFVVTQDVREYASMETEMLDGAFDAVIYSRGTLLDTGDPLFFMLQDFTCDGGYNIAQMCDPGVDRVVGDGMQLDVGEERRQATMDAEAAILQANGAVPLVHPLVVQGESGRMVDFARDPLERRLVTEYTRPAE